MHFNFIAVPTPKSQSDTRWGANDAAVKGVRIGYPGHISALKEIMDNPETKRITAEEATGLYNQMKNFEFCFFLCFWGDILSQFNRTSKSLQKNDLDINTAADLMNGLQRVVRDKKNRFEFYLEEATALCGHQRFALADKRVRFPNVRLHDDPQSATATIRLQHIPAAVTQEEARQQFKQSALLNVLDHVDEEMSRRKEAYQVIANLFGFLRRLHSLSSNELRAHAKALRTFYHDDLPDFEDELVDFAETSKAFSQKSDDTSFELHLYQCSHTLNIASTYPNVDTMLRIFNVQMITNCSGERSFSTMSHVKNKLRSAMTQTRMSSLVLLALNNDILREMNFDALINDFALRKARKTLL